MRRSIRRLPDIALVDGAGKYQQYMTPEIRYQEIKRRVKNAHYRVYQEEFRRKRQGAAERLAVSDIANQLNNIAVEPQPDDLMLDVASSRGTSALRLFDQGTPGSHGDADIFRRQETMRQLISHAQSREARASRPRVADRVNGLKTDTLGLGEEYRLDRVRLRTWI
jgi:hypothetical protein